MGISRPWRDFQGVVGRVEKLRLLFQAFHNSVTSTALFPVHWKRGGTSDSILQRRRSFSLAAEVFVAHSVSLS